jgi:hypothetical protein
MPPSPLRAEQAAFVAGVTDFRAAEIVVQQRRRSFDRRPKDQAPPDNKEPRR